MKTKLMMMAGLLAAWIPSPVEARIGETMEQCQARYGNRSEVADDQSRAVFWKEGIMVTCFFKGGKVWGLMFTVRPRPITVPGEPFSSAPMFTDQQTMALLEANGGKGWKAETGGVLSSADGKMKAVSNVASITIDTVERIEAIQALRQPAAIDQVIQGF